MGECLQRIREARGKLAAFSCSLALRLRERDFEQPRSGITRCRIESRVVYSGWPRVYSNS